MQQPLAGQLVELANGEAVTPPVRIECINKSERMSPDERIRSVGGTNADGGHWKLSTDEAVAAIEGGRWAFYVERPAANRAWVVVARSASGRKYLKTEADGEMPNNLLSLPECP